MKAKRVAALALALGMALLLAACGVANFDDSGAWAFDENASSQADSSGITTERKQELADQLSEVVAAYNDGVEEFTQAIDDKVTMPQYLSRDYDKMGPRVEELQETLQATANEMNEEEADQYERDLDNAMAQITNLRAELEKLVKEAAENPDSSAA